MSGMLGLGGLENYGNPLSRKFRNYWGLKLPFPRWKESCFDSRCIILIESNPKELKV